jgi:hypothetical protein
MMTEPETESYICTSHATPTKKKQKKAIRVVSEVRRSQRIAKICDGYKDKEAVDKAKEKGKSSIAEKEAKKPRGKKKQMEKATSELTSAFSA